MAGYEGCGAEPGRRQFSQAAGDETNTLNNPWASVFLKKNGTVVHCSGSLVHPEYVITAGHCFADKQGDYPPNPPMEELVVAFGVDDVSLIDAVFLVQVIQKRKIKKVYFHERYQYPQAYHDIVIVQLENPVKLSAKIYPICLPDFEDPDPNSMSGDSVTLVGYGPETDKSTKINELRHKIRGQRFCAAKYNPERTSTFLLRQKIETTLPKRFLPTLICANAPRSDEGTCSGDSGGPLIVEDVVDYDTFEVKYKLIAVLHGGIDNCDNSVYPAIYNRIAAPDNYQWILDTISGGCLTTADSPADKSSPCAIPFKYKGDLKDGCITEDDPDGRQWCSTKVDDNLKHIAGQGNWGYCTPSCPQHTISTTTTTRPTTRQPELPTWKPRAEDKECGTRATYTNIRGARNNCKTWRISLHGIIGIQLRNRRWSFFSMRWVCYQQVVYFNCSPLCN